MVISLEAMVNGLEEKLQIKNAAYYQVVPVTANVYDSDGEKLFLYIAR